MDTERDEVWGLLYPRVTSALSKGYCNGLFNPQKDKFFAATFVTEFPTADDLDFLKSMVDGGYRIIGKPSGLEGQGGWQLLPPGTGLQPADCKAYSVSFHGACYEWYFIPSLTFFETADDERVKDNILLPVPAFNMKNALLVS